MQRCYSSSCSHCEHLVQLSNFIFCPNWQGDCQDNLAGMSLSPALSTPPLLPPPQQSEMIKGKLERQIWGREVVRYNNPSELRIPRLQYWCQKMMNADYNISTGASPQWPRLKEIRVPPVLTSNIWLVIIVTDVTFSQPTSQFLQYNMTSLLIILHQKSSYFHLGYAALK